MKQLKIHKFKIKPLTIKLTIIKCRNNNANKCLRVLQCRGSTFNFHEPVGVLQFGSSVLRVLQFVVYSLEVLSGVLWFIANRRTKGILTHVLHNYNELKQSDVVRFNRECSHTCCTTAIKRKTIKEKHTVFGNIHSTIWG